MTIPTTGTTQRVNIPGKAMRPGPHGTELAPCTIVATEPTHSWVVFPGDPTPRRVHNDYTTRSPR